MENQYILIPKSCKFSSQGPAQGSHGHTTHEQHNKELFLMARSW